MISSSTSIANETCLLSFSNCCKVSRARDSHNRPCESHPCSLVARSSSAQHQKEVSSRKTWLVNTTELTFDYPRLRCELNDSREESSSTDCGAGFRDGRLRTGVKLSGDNSQVSRKFVVIAIAVTYNFVLALLVDLVQNEQSVSKQEIENGRNP